MRGRMPPDALHAGFGAAVLPAAVTAARSVQAVL
jgi:hypothetical protein